MSTAIPGIESSYHTLKPGAQATACSETGSSFSCVLIDWAVRLRINLSGRPCPASRRVCQNEEVSLFIGSLHFPQKVHSVKRGIAFSGFNVMSSWFRKSEDLRLRSCFSGCRLRQTCLERNPLFSTGDLEDKESSLSCLRGHGKSKQPKSSKQLTDSGLGPSY